MVTCFILSFLLIGRTPGPSSRGFCLSPSRNKLEMYRQWILFKYLPHLGTKKVPPRNNPRGQQLFQFFHLLAGGTLHSLLRICRTHNAIHRFCRTHSASGFMLRKAPVCPPTLSNAAIATPMSEAMSCAMKPHATTIGNRDNETRYSQRRRAIVQYCSNLFMFFSLDRCPFVYRLRQN